MINIVLPFAWLAMIIYPIWNIFWWVFVVYNGWKTQDSEIINLNLKENELPIITILLPLYREANVVSNLFVSIAQLDYPESKLDVKVVLEREDYETLDAVKDALEKTSLEVEIIFNGIKKGKPAALNAGLKKAKGEIVTVYDAEDVPERDQLKKVASYFKLHPDVVCVQAKLNYYNTDQSILTKFFTIEYSSWFDICLRGWCKSNWIIPLGGTSNFMKRDVLLKLMGWDEDNVTEDAELGIRLARNGYKTDVIDSTTWEEAVPYIKPWIKQRSRWNKGFLQCLITHCVHPVRLVKDVGLWRALSVVLVGISPIVTALSLIMWFFTISYSMYFLGFSFFEPLSIMIQEAFSNPLTFYLGLCCFLLGNIFWILCNLSGSIRRENWRLLKYVNLLVPYWILMSIGAWLGIIELIMNPSHWHKTPHGFSNNFNNKKRNG